MYQGLLTVAVLAACGAALWLYYSFDSALNRIDADLRKPRSKATARTDLPPEVLALAARIGAVADGPGFASFTQTGQMWRKPGGKALAFTARQTVRTDAAGFLWRARFGLPLPMVVADYYHDGIGGLEARLLGAIRVIQGVGPAFNQGEALRYLAEIPLNPDAILANRAVEWTVIDARTINVAMGVGEARGAGTFLLDDAGLIIGFSSPSRMALENGIAVPRPWKGRFWDYQQMGGRLVPAQAEVGWVREGGDFTYWRGAMQNWRAGAN